MKYLHDDGLVQLNGILSDCPVSCSIQMTSAASNHRTIHGRLECYTMKRAGTDKKIAGLLNSKFVEARELLESTLATTTTASSSQHVGTTSTPPRHHGNRKRSVSAGDAAASSSTSSGVVPMKMARHSTAPPSSAAQHHYPRGRSNSLDSAQYILRTTSTSSTHHHPSSMLPPPPQPVLDGSRLLTDLILTLNHSFPDYDFSNATANDFDVCSVAGAVSFINERLSEVAVSLDHNPQYYNNNNNILPSNSSSTTTNHNIHGTSAMTLQSSGVVGEASGSFYTGSTRGCFLRNLWNQIDQVITLQQVHSVYSYKPASETVEDDAMSFLTSLIADQSSSTYSSNDPHGSSLVLETVSENQVLLSDNDDTTLIKMEEQILWSFNYFFVNKIAKRILVFTCIETIQTPAAVMYRSPSKWSMSRRESAAGGSNGGGDNDSMSTGLALSDDRDEEDDDEEESTGDFDLDPANIVSGGIPIGTA